MTQEAPEAAALALAEQPPRLEWGGVCPARFPSGSRPRARTCLPARARGSGAAGEDPGGLREGAGRHFRGREGAGPAGLAGREPASGGRAPPVLASTPSARLWGVWSRSVSGRAQLCGRTRYGCRARCPPGRPPRPPGSCGLRSRRLVYLRAFPSPASGSPVGGPLRSSKI